jgi:hypothetical protein
MCWYKIIKTSSIYGYWISPDGKEIEVKDFLRHADIAKEIGFNSLDDIFIAGYTRICMYKGFEIQTYNEGQLTDAQKQTISRLYLNKRRENPDITIVGGFDYDPDRYIVGKSLNQVFNYLTSGTL